MAIPIIKAETFDIPSFDAFGGSKEDPWREEAFNKYTSELEKLETELKSVQANLIKESIRVSSLPCPHSRQLPDVVPSFWTDVQHGPRQTLLEDG